MLVSICSKCYEDLWKKGAPALYVYQQICIEFVKKGKCQAVDSYSGFKKGDPEILKFLEKKRYIVTTELNIHCVRIKPLGHFLEENNTHFFCKENKKHDS